MGKLDNQVAIITGGASGIGAESVRLFIKEGAHVVIADIQDERGERLAAEFGPRAVYVHTDVTSETDVAAAVDEAVAQFGRLDCIFNNAGIPGGGGPIESLSLRALDQIVKVHLYGVILGMKHAAPVMKRQGSGSIINTGSVAGLRTGWGSHAYSAAKAAIIHVTRSVATELGESGVRVNCICPGGMTTPIFGVAFGVSREEADGTIESLEPSFANLQPIRRAGHPRDIAHAALWLASEDASFVNGHVLVVDGGATVGRGWSEYQELYSALRSEMGLEK